MFPLAIGWELLARDTLQYACRTLDSLNMRGLAKEMPACPVSLQLMFHRPSHSVTRESHPGMSQAERNFGQSGAALKEIRPSGRRLNDYEVSSSDKILSRG